MRAGFGVVVGLLVLTLMSPPTQAGREAYLLGGPNFASLTGDPPLLREIVAPPAGVAMDGERRVGFDLGGGFSYTTKGILGAAAELHFVSRGAKWVFPTEPERTDALRLTYLEVPLLLQVAPRVGSSIRPCVLLGPEIGFRARALHTSETGGVWAPAENLQPSAAPVFLAGVGAAGLRISASARSAVLVQARLVLGLTHLLRGEGSEPSLRQRDVMVLLGYSVSL